MPSMDTSSSFLLIPNINCKVDFGDRVETADFETAVHYCRYGKFQSLLMAVSGAIYATCAISTTTLSFVLPSAECDFNLSSADKGKLSAMPLIGMIFGCSLWGSIANCQGRRTAIILSLLVDFVAAVLSSIAHTFNMFLICRFFNGFGIIGATSIVFSYLGEFASKKHRDVMLGRLEVFWNVGVIVLPGVAWILLNRSLLDNHDAENNNFSPWRVFVLVCSLPSLISLVLLYFLPETPKFYIAKGKFDHAKMVFQQVFACNTGQPLYNYPVVSLEGEFENNNNLKFDEGMPFMFRICQKFSTFRHHMLMLFSEPYVRYLAIASFADFGLMSSYYTLLMWFPEIFERFTHFEKKYPDVTAGVCTVSESSFNETETYMLRPCNSTVDGRVFLDTIIIGLSCIPSSVSLSFFMRKLGKKFVLMFGLIMAGVATLSLNWVVSKTQTLVLSCFFEALTSILEAVVFCVVVDLFPTSLRAIALAITATCGRIGAIMGNFTFGLLIDIKCVIPIYLFGSFLIASGILCTAIPKSDKYIVLH